MSRVTQITVFTCLSLISGMIDYFYIIDNQITVKAEIWSEDLC